ncbi:VOC family protein [Rhodococcus yananensis]|uniref:VOC family protein n=1 Tax=Rhodococcus yananensis TaxID=2879464 RepID=UPI003EBE3B88
MEILSSRTILRPADYDAALEFYGTTLGLAIAREYPGGTVFFAGQGLVEIAAHGDTGSSSDPQRFRGALWLQVRDVYAAQDELVASGVTVVREARAEPWGLHELWIADPDGIPVVLVQIPPEHPIRRDVR